MSSHDSFLEQAIELATRNVVTGGGPFGTVIVRDGEVIATGANQVTAWNDPTAHAEIVAIRAACKALSTFKLEGCTFYCSCEPCPMCLGAIYWSRASAVYYANTHLDAASIGFDDSRIYAELRLPAELRQLPMIRIDHPNALDSFRAWSESTRRIEY